MHRRRLPRMLVATTAIVALVSTVVARHERVASAGPLLTSWLTRSYDTNRSSANLSESYLTSTSVVPGNFGLEWLTTVDDQVYAQPLYAFQFPMAKGPENVLFVATANNTVYAFDADTASLIWQKNFNNGNPAPDGSQVVDMKGCVNFANPDGLVGNGHVGILGTPVIDPNYSPPRLFVVTHTMENCSGNCNNTNMVFRLRSINVVTGNETTNSVALGQFSGFDSSLENQRAGLALANGNIYVPFASYCDNGDTGTGYHGYVFLINESLTDSSGAFYPELTGQAGGIWQSGQAPAVEPVSQGQPDVFVAVGNGDTSGIVSSTDSDGGGNSLGPNFGDTVVGLNPNGGTSSSRTWTPDNFAKLQQGDLDLGVAGPSLLPLSGSTLVHIIQASKESKIYNLVFDSSQSNYTISAAQPFLTIPGTDVNIHGIVTVPGNGIPSLSPAVYVLGDSGGVTAFQMDKTSGKMGPVFSNTNDITGGGYASLSASGGVQHTGILWVTTPAGSNATSHRTLFALNAETLKSMWNSDQNRLEDGLGSGVYWNPPTIVNGRVYVATASPDLLLSNLPPNYTWRHAIVAYGIQYPYTFVARPAAPHVAWMRCASCLAQGIYHVGSSGALYARTESNGIWGKPSAIGSSNFAPPGAGIAIAPQTASQTDAFVVGNDGTVEMIAYTTSGWQAPLPVSGANLAPPGAAITTVNQAGQLGALFFDTTGAMRIIWWNPALGWLGPVTLTAANYAPPGAMLAAGIRSSGEVDVFAIGSDGAVKYMAFNGSVWSGPYPLTVTNFAPPGAPVATAQDIHGFTNVLVVGNDGAIYTKWDATPLWSGPTALTATGFAPPSGFLSAINFANQSLNIFAVDAGGTIQVLTNPGLGWQGPTAVGVNLAPPGGLVVGTVESASQLDLFAVSSSTTSGQIESVYTNGTWSAPSALP